MTLTVKRIHPASVKKNRIHGCVG